MINEFEVTKIFTLMEKQCRRTKNTHNEMINDTEETNKKNHIKQKKNEAEEEKYSH